MRRDMDLVRHILLRTELAETSYDAGELVTECWPFDVVAYHLELMEAHGLIDVKVIKAGNDVPVRATVKALTWDGCDYLDAIRNDTIWERTKAHIRERVGSTTMDVIKATAIAVTKQALGI